MRLFSRLVMVAMVTMTASASPLGVSKRSQITKTRREAIFDALTANTWTARDMHHPKQTEQTGLIQPGFQMPFEYSVTTYRGDGVLHVSLVTDYVPSPFFEGRWTLEEEHGGQVFLRLESGKRMRIDLDRNGQLRINGEPRYKWAPVSNRIGSFGELKPLALPEEARKLGSVLCAHRWKRPNDLNWDSEPTLVEFRSDLTYTSTYRNGQRVNQGRWWAGQSSRWNPYEWQGIEGEGPGGCDPRAADPTYPEQLRIAALPDGNISINGDPYVPESMPLTIGDSRSIWRLWEDKRLDVRMKYALPMAPGKHVSVEIEVTYREDKHDNTSGPIQLDRLTLARPAQQMVEFATQDLKGLSLSPGETKTFSVEVDFPLNTSQVQWSLQVQSPIGKRQTTFWCTLASPEWREHLPVSASRPGAK